MRWLAREAAFKDVFIVVRVCARGLLGLLFALVAVVALRVWLVALVALVGCALPLRLTGRLVFVEVDRHRAVAPFCAVLVVVIVHAVEVRQRGVEAACVRRLLGLGGHAHVPLADEVGGVRSQHTV